MNDLVRKGDFTFILKVVLVCAGFMLGAALNMPVTAHTPCNTYEPPKTCKYVQVVNPYTGKLQQEYVCD